jgi:UDP-glucose 6-dehydrogenase
MIGDIANRLGCDAYKILNAIGNDSRVGNKYLKPGFGFGGPCFPRDNRALSKCSQDLGVDAVICKATDEMNEKHLQYQIEDFINGNPNKEKIIEIDSLSYKKGSDSLEESQQLKFALKLIELGYKVRLINQKKEILNQIKNYGFTY